MPTKTKKIRVLMAAAEAAPLAKVGGLGDVLGALPKVLAKKETELSLVLPFYGSLNLKASAVKLLQTGISIDIDQTKKKFDVYQTKLPGTKINVYLIKHTLFNGKYIYANYDNSTDDLQRYTFFSQAIVAMLEALALKFDIIHCHDWHTALVPSYLDEYSLRKQDFVSPKTILTIHNLANQGLSSLDILDYGALHQAWSPAVLEDYYDQDENKADLLKIGILSADMITTVSPTYAQEILTKKYGAGLENYLNRRRQHLLGILNGIDVSLFNPQTDKYLKYKYTAKNAVSAKASNKQALQKKLKLAIKPVPMFGLVSRLVEQKGFDILLPALEKFLAKHSAQVVILGTGSKEIEQALLKLAKKFPDKLSVQLGFDLGLAQNIYAATDFFLMPSAFEPCGLGQMIAMRYGSLPIVRATGGLKDTVKHYYNGLIFLDYQAAALFDVLEQALVLFAKTSQFHTLLKNALAADWSWEKSAQKYLALYNKLI